VLGAITLFLKGGLPWLAADCVNNNSSCVLKVYDLKKRNHVCLQKINFIHFFLVTLTRKTTLMTFKTHFQKKVIKHQDI
jgi:expansin (peptidoglycan-binding protein)